MTDRCETMTFRALCRRLGISRNGADRILARDPAALPPIFRLGPRGRRRVLVRDYEIWLERVGGQRSSTSAPVHNEIR